VAVAVAVHPMTVLLRVPAVRAAAACVHEEVGDGGELQAQLLGDGDLHLLGGTAVLSEDGYQGATLQVGEDQSLLLWQLVALSSSVLLLTFTCWRGGGKGPRKRGQGQKKRKEFIANRNSQTIPLHLLKTKHRTGWKITNNAIYG